MKKNLLRKLMTALLTAVFITGSLAGCQKAPSSASDQSQSQNTSENSNTSSGTTETATDTGAGNSKDVVTIYAATGGAPKPFTYVNDSTNELEGHNIELIKAVFAKLPQYKLVIEKTDFASIFAGLDSDRYQIGVNNFAMNEERKEKYLFSDPIFKDQYVAIVASNNDSLNSVNSLSDLAGLNFIGEAAVNSTTAVENYNKENPDKQIKVNYTEEDLVLQLQDVESGKYDFLLIDKPMYEYYNKEYNFNLKELEVSSAVSTSLMAEPYSYLLISKGNEQLQQDINKALQEVIADGTSKKINEKYFGADYTPDAK